MLRFSRHQSPRALALLMAMTFALSACGGSSATPVPSANPGSSEAGQPSAAGQPTDTAAATGLAGAAAALSSLDSFKFTMTETGGSLGDTLSMLPVPASGNPSFKLSGTVVLQPTEAGDVTVADTLHVVSVGGSDYQDIGLTGAFTKNDSTTPSIIDSLSPISVFTDSFGSSFDFTGFDNVGSETKDGVDSDHYKTNDSGNAALAEFGSVGGIQADKWNAEIWLAKNGGYPVAMTVTGTTGTTVAYERTFDLTKVNDSANKVTAPANVTGA